MTRKAASYSNKAAVEHGFACNCGGSRIFGFLVLFLLSEKPGRSKEEIGNERFVLRKRDLLTALIN